MNPAKSTTPIETDQENQWITRAQQGDPEAVSFLYEAHVQAIYRYISYRVAQDTIAEDLTSEVFVRMVQALPRYEQRGVPFRAWLYRIAASRIAEHYRSQPTPAETLSEEQPSDDTDPFGKMAKQEERAHLQTALAQLPAEQQTLLILRFMQERTHEEVAAVLGKSIAAVRVMQHRALKALASALGEAHKARSYLRGEQRHE